MTGKSKMLPTSFASLLLGSALLLGACEQKEEVLDVETPAGEVEVERDKSTGDLDIEVKKKRERKPD